MARRAPFPLSRMPASTEHSMKLLCVRRLSPYAPTPTPPPQTPPTHLNPYTPRRELLPAPARPPLLGAIGAASSQETETMARAVTRMMTRSMTRIRRPSDSLAALGHYEGPVHVEGRHLRGGGGGGEGGYKEKSEERGHVRE